MDTCEKHNKNICTKDYESVNDLSPLLDKLEEIRERFLIEEEGFVYYYDLFEDGSEINFSLWKANIVNNRYRKDRYVTKINGKTKIKLNVTVVDTVFEKVKQLIVNH